MKKIVLLVTSALIGFSSMAQEGIHIGVKGGPQYSFMLNSDISDAQEIDFIGTWSSAFDVTTNYHFSETLWAGIDLMFSTISQKYEFYESAPSDFDAKLDAKYMRIPVLLHFNSDPSAPVMFKGFFGPQFSLLNGATFTNNYKAGSGADGKDPKEIIDGDTGDKYIITDPALLAEMKSGDRKTTLNGTSIGVALGLGFAINFTEYLNFNAGLNLGYDFTDSGAGNIWTPVDIDHTDSDFLGGDSKVLPGATNNITGGIEFGITYVIQN